MKKMGIGAIALTLLLSACGSQDGTENADTLQNVQPTSTVEVNETTDESDTTGEEKTESASNFNITWDDIEEI